MVQGQVFLKQEGGGGRVLAILHLEITLCKIVLCIWKKKFFFWHRNFMKKDHSKLSENAPENIP